MSFSLVLRERERGGGGREGGREGGGGRGKGWRGERGLLERYASRKGFTGWQHFEVEVVADGVSQQSLD